MQEEEEVKTLVWWNISSCPIPPGYDPRQVGRRIVSALKNSEVSGPVTITAIGRLTHNPNAPDDGVLPELSSSGIALIYSKELQTNLFMWMERNPPPANIMLISGPKELESLARTLYSIELDGYTIFLAYPHRDPASAWLWKSFLFGVDKEWLWTSILGDVDSGSTSNNKQEPTRLVLQDKCSETGESPWSCSMCFFAGQNFEDLSIHLKSDDHKNNALDLVKMADVMKLNQIKTLGFPVFGTPEHNPEMVDMVQLKEEEENEEVKTLVWWNINSCPIPPDYDPCQVGPRILSALKNSEVSGPVTITAIGRLTHNPNAPDDGVLRELSSTGIALIYSKELQTNLFMWMERNPPPANIMLISGPKELESLARTLYSIELDGYTIFLAYPHRDPASAWLWKSFLFGVDKEWLWTSILEDDMDSGSTDSKQEITRLVLQDKCSETGESPWSCSMCFFAGQNFEDLSIHLKSDDHKNNALDLVKVMGVVNLNQALDYTVFGAPKQNQLKKTSKKRKFEGKVEEDAEEGKIEEDTEDGKVEEDS
ncbi:PREDICTED: uncharacterized protein LOC104719010 isoform X2 [Camelina sativa]|uniref:Uncharacterized protein LOC104719010 isoform X2 n=1 Tax=Camelina sativa TaxID=90675 RepID=A0ABM0U383_CAMSA|nr:PREDICTED: uncharacterized protein LOC104719010 isoform X2 [Camelina sativa]